MIFYFPTAFWWFFHYRKGNNMRFLSGLFFITTFFNATAAITECVNISATTVCETSDDCYNVSDCSINCRDLNVNIIGRCAETSGTADTSVSNDVSISSTDSANIHCWCALSHPIASKWIMRYTYHTADQCLINCARGCRNAMIYNNTTDTTFRTTMFNNLIE